MQYVTLFPFSVEKPLFLANTLIELQIQIKLWKKIFEKSAANYPGDRSPHHALSYTVYKNIQAFTSVVLLSLFSSTFQKSSERKWSVSFI